MDTATGVGRLGMAALPGFGGFLSPQRALQWFRLTRDLRREGGDMGEIRFAPDRTRRDLLADLIVPGLRSGTSPCSHGTPPRATRENPGRNQASTGLSIQEPSDSSRDRPFHEADRASGLHDRMRGKEIKESHRR